MSSTNLHDHMLVCVWVCTVIISGSDFTPQAVYYSVQPQAASLESVMEKRPLGKLRSTKPRLWN